MTNSELNPASSTTEASPTPPRPEPERPVAVFVPTNMTVDSVLNHAEMKKRIVFMSREQTKQLRMFPAMRIEFERFDGILKQDDDGNDLGRRYQTWVFVARGFNTWVISPFLESQVDEIQDGLRDLERQVERRTARQLEEQALEEGGLSNVNPVWLGFSLSPP